MKEVLQKVFAAIRVGRWDVAAIGLVILLGRMPDAISWVIFPRNWPAYLCGSLGAIALVLFLTGFLSIPLASIGLVDNVLTWLLSTVAGFYLTSVIARYPVGWLYRHLLLPAKDQTSYAIKDAKKNWRDFEPRKANESFDYTQDTLDKLSGHNPDLYMSLNDDGELVEFNR